jgi:hypothetical protein
MANYLYFTKRLSITILIKDLDCYSFIIIYIGIDPKDKRRYKDIRN